jgi:hypothetical protein
MSKSFTDEDHRVLLITSCETPGHALLRVNDGDVSETCVGAAELPGVIAAMYEAAGLPAPVILERPETTPAGTSTAIGFVYPFRSARGDLVGVVTSEVRDAYLTPTEARKAAAVIAAYADEADADPDPAEVEELAAFIRSAHHPDSGKPGDSDRTAARAALRGMQNREARNA